MAERSSSWAASLGGLFGLSQSQPTAPQTQTQAQAQTQTQTQPAAPHAQAAYAPPALLEPATAATAATAADNETAEHKRALKWRTKILQSSPIVQFMLKELDKAGCTLQPDHFKCVPCDPTRAGGFAPTHGIVLCENQLTSKSHMEDTMAHELIHAFDHCTARVKWDKPEHFACSEIRAAALSGDCRFSRELMRGNLGFFKHFQECVRRRAVLGVKQAPTCQADGVAEDAVRAVWDSCFNDTAPFDEIF